MKTAKLLILSALFVVLGFQLKAQGNYSLSGSQVFTVEGTSTIHDWEMVSKEGVKGNMDVTINGSEITSISSLKIILPVESLKSGKSSMDKNAYECLNQKKNPNILYELVSVDQISADKIKAKGKMTIAGQSKDVIMEVNYKLNNGTVVFEGNQDITFSEYKLDPPTAMFNTIKTGNELKLTFKAQFQPN
ncbi:YceI family protein [Echinicola marina]|uniref:YceI family protein n=1 Tax=Echinicola marina TaxID=2859768 RepID=UPI001CF6F837|nr:YceI family protein [Echinicola marina]UCS93023.1 YceI family protein [Echinicola marina]